MFQLIKDNPSALIGAMANELARRNQVADGTDIDQIATVIHAATATAVYATKAKALLTRPLKSRGIEVDGRNWRRCAIGLYALWLGISLQEAEARMARLATQANKWQQAIPDEQRASERDLLDFYKSLGPFEGCGVHDYNDLALALRWYVAEVLAAVAGGRGVYDFGGGDGVSCTFMRHLGAAGVTLIELNPAARDFSAWLNKELGLSDVAYCESPPSRRFGAGMSTEVLEHVIDPLAFLKTARDLLEPGGVLFVTSSFGMPGDQHLKANTKWAGHEGELMRMAGFVPWNPPRPAPIPFLGSWGFWKRQ